MLKEAYSPANHSLPHDHHHEHRFLEFPSKALCELNNAIRDDLALLCFAGNPLADGANHIHPGSF